VELILCTYAPLRSATLAFIFASYIAYIRIG